ncbi:hypothetical protein L1987_82531 [Smallanthus sonchifolius]|uniref:Uncharacterized protein n=1 Tax=Smallanthus sonchifolius TaxID=185202 RepID=A0ACB8YBB4_9ASTR|nr:hypothetical protein L1987_82531 [Smallanthus sonchifolius]
MRHRFEQVQDLIVAPSQASFSDGVQTFDTVGILVGEGWALPKEVSLKWQNKKYRCWFQVEDEDWCPGWITKPEKKLTSVHNLVTSDEVDQESPEHREEAEQSMPVPEVQSRVLGERIQVHGETGKGINCGTVPTVEQSSPTNKVYYFGSKNVGSHSAHERNLSPKIQEVAHRIITFGTGPISRKRQRLDSRMEDPFDLDRFIGGAPGLATQKNISGNTIPVGESSRFHPLPDLNSQIIRPPQDEQGNSDQVGGGGRNWIGGGRSAEVDATINMGKELGANLINLEELVRTVIEGEMETEMVQ